MGETDTALVRLDAFQQALAEASTIPEVKGLLDQADLFRQWLRKQKAGHEAQNAGFFMAVSAARKLGAMLGGIQREDGLRTDTTSSPQETRLQQVMREHNIKHGSAHRWQQLAAIPEEVLTRYFAEANEAAEEAYTAAFIRYYAALHQPEDLGDWAPLPDGKYRTIVIDPPWPLKKILRRVRPKQFHTDFPVKSPAEITALDVPSKMADDGCHIYLWTTQKQLPHTFPMLAQWGLKYTFTMVWHKNGGFQPYGLPQYNCEFVLFGRKNGLAFLTTQDFFTCFHGTRREHSRKPSEFFDLVRRVSPGPRLNMFTREHIEGYDPYGGDIDRFD